AARRERRSLARRELSLVRVAAVSQWHGLAPCESRPCLHPAARGPRLSPPARRRRPERPRCRDGRLRAERPGAGTPDGRATALACGAAGRPRATAPRACRAGDDPTLTGPAPG